MARHRDRDWDLGGTEGPKGKSQGVSDGHMIAAVLMDIRQELHTLNERLGCPNFIRIPAVLDGIRRKLPARRKAKRKARASR